MLVGQISREWRTVQEKYIREHSTKIDIERWTKAFIRKLWLVSWDIWDFRNDILHNSKTQQQQREQEALLTAVREAFRTPIPSTGPNRFTGLTDQTRISKLPNQAITKWIDSITLFRQRTATSDTTSTTPNTSARSSRSVMRNWLNSG